MRTARKFRAKQVLPYIAVALLAYGTGSAYAQGAMQVGVEQSANVHGINVMCTGVGIGAREEAMHSSYPLRVEIAGRNGQYLGDNTVELGGGQLAAPVMIHCMGPWVLFDVPDGSYSVTTRAGEGNESKTARVNVGGAGQDRLVMQFPALGGATSQDRGSQQIASAK
jgi:hypothetical protein